MTPLTTLLLWLYLLVFASSGPLWGSWWPTIPDAPRPPLWHADELP